MANLEMNIRQANADFVAIKEKIVEKGIEVANGTRTADYARKVEEVYEAGKDVINNEVELVNSELEEILYGTDTGGKSWYDAFWDAFQENGNRNNYRYTFYGKYWNDSIYNPKHPIICNGQASAQDMFYTSCVTDTKVDIYFGEGNTNSRAFGSDSLVTIRKLHVAAGVGFINTFQNAINLVNLIIEGVIDQDGLNLQWSTKLSKASIESIINALSTTTSGLSITLSKTAKEAAFTADEWEALIATRKNWTISLV